MNLKQASARAGELGMTLLELMVAVGLASMLSLWVFTLQNSLSVSKLKANNAYTADQIRKEVQSWLTDPTSWKATIAAAGNVSFACLSSTPATNCLAALNNGPPANDYTAYIFANSSSGVACTHANAFTGSCQGGFNVYYTNANQAATTFYAPTSSSHLGFGHDGHPCDAAGGLPGFNPAISSSGYSLIGASQLSSKCPFRLVLWWVPICINAAKCYSPQVHVKGYMLYAPSPSDPYETVAPNPNEYGIDMILPPNS